MTFGQSENYCVKHISCEQFDREASPRHFSVAFVVFLKVKATNQQLSFKIFL